MRAGTGEKWGEDGDRRKDEVRAGTGGREM